MLFQVIAYAYQCGIYSSRKIEEACRYRIDFLWLLDSREAPDDATIARFRTGRCKAALEDLFTSWSLIWRKNSEKQLAKVKDKVPELGYSGLEALRGFLKTQKAKNVLHFRNSMPYVKSREREEKSFVFVSLHPECKRDVLFEHIMI